MPAAPAKGYTYGGGNCTTVKTGGGSDGGGNGGGGGDDDNDPPRPIEPVLPFFTLPDMPPLPAFNRIGGNGATTAPLDRGYQQRGVGVSALAVNDGGAYRPTDKFYGGGVVVVSPVATIDCFVGDQRQSDDENNHQNDGGGGGGSGDSGRDYNDGDGSGTRDYDGRRRDRSNNDVTDDEDDDNDDEVEEMAAVAGAAAVTTTADVLTVRSAANDYSGPKTVPLDSAASGEIVALSNRIRRAMECPVCLLLAWNMSCLCPNGHAVCGACLEQLWNRDTGCSCPLCRAPMEITPDAQVTAVKLAQVVANAMVPCAHRSYGCPKLLALYDVAHHEDQCPHAPHVRCMVSVCQWIGVYDQLFEHVRCTHHDVAIETTVNGTDTTGNEGRLNTCPRVFQNRTVK